MIRLCRALCVLLISMSLVGCSTRAVLTTLGIGAAAAAGGAAVYYAKGDLEADVPHDLDKTYEATKSAMNKRGYNVTSESKDTDSARIEADIPAIKDEKERKLTIKLNSKDADNTHISIRVGTFGDETLSQAIYSDIQSEL